MYISHKSNVLQQFHDTEWQCRRMSKNLGKAEYWAWLATITTQDEDGKDVITYPSEDFTIVYCNDEDVNERFVQLRDYIGPDAFNIKYYTAKRDADEILDPDGNSILDDKGEKTYIQSHFIGQDDTRDARLLAEKWEGVRMQRNHLIAKTDYLALSDQTLAADWATYRQDLRDVPTQSDPDDISWPTKPS